MSAQPSSVQSASKQYTNRRAHFDYELLERFEAGIALTGSEIKSIRASGVDFRDAFATFDGRNLTLEGLYVPPYKEATYNNHEPRRKRQLLLNRSELVRIRKALEAKGLTVVPTRMYFKGPFAKIEIAIARGKKLYDKRRAEAEKTVRKELRDL